MTQKIQNPAALACADRARKSDGLAAVTSKNITSPNEFQSLGSIAESVIADLAMRRAAHLVWRFRLSPAMARAVAELAFGEGASQ